MYSWRDAHEEFFAALDDAKTYEQAWWEEQASASGGEQRKRPIMLTLWSRSKWLQGFLRSIGKAQAGNHWPEGTPLLAGIQVLLLSQVSEISNAQFPVKAGVFI